MNKDDFKLVFILLIIVILFLLGFKLSSKDENMKALVYYEDEVVLTIDLEKELNKIYEVDGYNGKVTIVVKDGKIKVDEENSPLHLCSKQGYISSSYETIVCLPNKITIKIESDDSLDTVVK